MSVSSVGFMYSSSATMSTMDTESSSSRQAPVFNDNGIGLYSATYIDGSFVEFHLMGPPHHEPLLVRAAIHHDRVHQAPITDTTATAITPLVFTATSNSPSEAQHLLGIFVGQVSHHHRGHLDSGRAVGRCGALLQGEL